MKKHILFVLMIGISIGACRNANEKEIGEVESLLAIVKDTEKALLNVDTSKVFTTKRQMEKDLEAFNSITDTLNKKEAFKVADIFGSKKKLFRLTKNYPGFITQIEFSRNQLNNLKQDLENGLMSKEDFNANYASEQAAVMELNHNINKAINGLEVVLQKFELDRPELLEMIEQRKLKAVETE